MAGTDTYILTLASQIVTAHVSHNVVESAAIAGLIRNVYNTLLDLCGSAGVVPREVHAHHHHHHVHSPPRQPHGSPSRTEGHVHPEYGQTVFDDHLVCMEDGLRMKMLKRHLQTVHGLTPDEYRAKWGLSPNYPMVAANYARLRSSLAVESGLGLKPEALANRGIRSRS